MTETPSSPAISPASSRSFLMNLWEPLEMIKIQHTIFALPFALLSMFIAAGGMPGLWTFVWILVAMVSARSGAMAFNRFADADFDAKNPRTSERAIPAGRLNRKYAVIFSLASAAIFILSAAMLNTVCFVLSPVALAVLYGYSYSKRFTSLSHFWLGIALGLAPAGAWLAVKGNLAPALPRTLELGLPFEPFPVILLFTVLTWTAGFDILYACQDIDVDRRDGLRSIPARLGVRGALIASAAVHAVSAAVLLMMLWYAPLGWGFTIGVAGAILLLIYEHAIVRPSNLDRVGRAFLAANGTLSLWLLAGVMLDVFVLKS